MRKMLWVLCGLSIAVPVFAAETDPCKRNKELFLGEAAKYDCPEEEAEGKGLACTGGGMADLKNIKRFSELVKLCHSKPKKGGASSSSSSSTKPAVDMKMSPVDAAELPEGAHKYRGVDADGKVLAIAGSDKSGADAIGQVKDQIKTKVCDGKAERVDFTLQLYTSKKDWAKGIASYVRCKK